MRRWYRDIIVFCCILVDIFLIYFSFYLAFQIRFFFPIVTQIFPLIKGLPEWYYYNQAIISVLPFWIGIFAWRKLYKFSFSYFFDDFLRIIGAIFVAMVFMLFLSFFYRGYEFSRLVVGFSGIICVVLIFSWHLFIKTIINTLGRFLPIRRILIIGHVNPLSEIRRRLRHYSGSDVIFLPNFSYDKFERILNEKDIDEIITVEKDMKNEDLLILADKCNEMKISFKVLPDILQLRRGEIVIDEKLGLPVYQIKSVSLTGANFYIKRGFDIIVSAILVSFLSPLFLLISFLIKLTSRGPALYSHERKGLNGKVFKFYKFRTMCEGADKLLDKLMHQSDRMGPVFKMKNDPRITTVGKILRKYSLDELPQLFNVLRGEMSLVGPRPQVLWEAQFYDKYARRRLNVLPGITGLWQVSGRADTSYDEMIKLDIYYIENWSLGLDLSIILRTIPVVISRKGAY